MFNREDILQQAQRKYPAFLHSLVTGAPFFPLPITLGKTRRAESYEERRAELAEIRQASASMGFDVQWRTVSDPRFGPHERPESAQFSTVELYLRAIGKTSEVERFQQDITFILKQFPALLEWISNNTQRVIEKHGYWPRLLRVVEWFHQNARCGLYLRQLPIAGVDTKFMEKHEKVLDQVISLLFPEHVTLDAATFRSRHGLREEESTLRIRFLDKTLQQECGLPLYAADLALPLSEAAHFPAGRITVFITENLRNFLALPDHPRSLVILGGGDASIRLKRIAWLDHCEVYYWGDIDQHGFAMLARLRAAFPHIKSFLMNADTLVKWWEFVVDDETTRISLSLHLLTETETSVFHDVHSTRRRLEQERVPITEVEQALLRLLDTSKVTQFYSP